jgi:diguanylate cyclase (GGDEF)-like protein
MARETLTRRTAVRRIAPFAGACLLAWIAVPVGSSIHWPEYWFSFVMAWSAGGLALVSITTGSRPWLAVVPSALLLLGSVSLLRDAGGGIPSGASALAILPVFQTALYSRSRRDLFVVLAAVALFFIVPVLVVGPPLYPTSQYRTSLLVVAAYGIIGLTTQQLVARVLRQAAEAKQRERMLEQINQVVHNLFDSPSPRTDICQAMMSIARASGAVLFEPVSGSELLACTAMAGLDLDRAGLVAGERSPAYQAMSSGQPVMINQYAETRISLKELWLAAERPSSLLYQPLKRGDLRLGVLVIAWHDHVRAEEARTAVVALLAHEAAAVITRADAMDHLNDEALTDALTGLPNRRAWETQLKQSASTGKRLTIAVLDLDHFKQFNDTFGHPAGDRLLKETAAAWRDQLRSGDVLARIGGEEFGLLLLDCDASTAQDVVGRLRSRVTRNRTCSAGIAVQRQGEKPESVLERADAALYDAKAGGRNAARVAETLPA